MAGLPGYNGASSFTGGLDCGPLAFEVPMAGAHVAEHMDNDPASEIPGGRIVKDGDKVLFRRARCLEAAVWLGLKPATMLAYETLHGTLSRDQALIQANCA